jgi:hypothetical protein
MMDFSDGPFDGSFPGSDSGAPPVEGYEFTISNGQVTGIERVIGTNSFNLPLPGDATFAVGAGSVTETIAHTSATDVIQYVASPTDATLYNLSSETETYANPVTLYADGVTLGYSFTVANGAVTAMQEVLSRGSHTDSFDLPLSPSTTLSISGGTVTETSVQGNTIDTVAFVQPSGSTLYAVASTTTTFVQPGTATTLLSVNPYDRAEFTIDGSGNVTQIQSVSPTGTTAIVTPDSHFAFSQLAPGFVEETATFGTHTSYAVYYEGGASGIYTEVAHGTGTTVDLVGLKAQLAQLPPGIEALV